MSKDPINMTDLPADAQAFVAEKLAGKEAELMGLKAAHAVARTSFTQTLKTRDTIIADLRMQLDGHKKHRFGSRSESLDQLVMELIQEEDEIGQSIDEADTPTDTDAKPPHTPRKRKPYTTHTPI